jgi:hypothetical protein
MHMVVRKTLSCRCHCISANLECHVLCNTQHDTQYLHCHGATVSSPCTSHECVQASSRRSTRCRLEIFLKPDAILPGLTICDASTCFQAEEWHACKLVVVIDNPPVATSERCNVNEQRETAAVYARSSSSELKKKTTNIVVEFSSCHHNMEGYNARQTPRPCQSNACITLCYHISVERRL